MSLLQYPVHGSIGEQSATLESIVAVEPQINGTFALAQVGVGDNVIGQTAVLAQGDYLVWLAAVLIPLVLLLAAVLIWRLAIRSTAIAAKVEENDASLVAKPRKVGNEKSKGDHLLPDHEMSTIERECEPQFSDFDFGDEPSDADSDENAKPGVPKQGFDLAAPENIDFDDVQGHEQEDLLTEMYQEDERLSDELGLEAVDQDADDEDSEKENKKPGKKKSQFQTIDDFDVDEFQDEDELDLSDDTEQDFDTCLEMEDMAENSDSFGTDVTQWQPSADVLDQDDVDQCPRAASAGDTAVGIEGMDSNETRSGIEALQKQQLETFQQELAKLAQLNQDLLEDRTYLDTRLQENENALAAMAADRKVMKSELDQSLQVSSKQARTIAELHEQAELHQAQLGDAFEQPSELQADLLLKMHAELEETNVQYAELKSLYQALVAEREQLLQVLNDGEMNSYASTIDERERLVQEVSRLKLERDMLADKADSVSLNGHLS